MNELKLDIGCGGRGSRQKGFIGIDIWPLPEGKTKEEYLQLDFVHDALPWAVDSVDEAIALHMIEHLTLDEGQLMLMKAAMLLKPGAVLTVTCPDLRKLATAYVEENETFLKSKHLRGGKDIWPGATLADRLNAAIHGSGHKWAYDQDSLIHHAIRAVSQWCFVSRMSEDSRRWTRPDHEIGIEIMRRITRHI